MGSEKKSVLASLHGVLPTALEEVRIQMAKRGTSLSGAREIANHLL